MREVGGAHLITRLRDMKKGSWFGNYRELFRRLLDIDWENSSADVQFLEQVILTRNDFSHNLEFGSLTAYQTDEHSKKCPQSAFADPRWKMSAFRKSLIVPRERVDQAIEVVHSRRSPFPQRACCDARGRQANTKWPKPVALRC